MGDGNRVVRCSHLGHGPGISRRDFLQVGAIGGLGLTLGGFLKVRAAEASLAAGPVAAAGSAPAAESVIHIFLPGGIAAQESFDPKPYAPIEYRGPMGSIETKIAGVRFNEHLKDTAQIADRLSIIRSMSHGEAAHERGTHNMFTGYKPSPALQYPSFGSVVSHELGSRKGLPPYVCIPAQPNPYAGAGYMSSAFGPFSVGGDPGDPNFAVRDLSLPAGISPERFEKRKGLLAAVDEHFRAAESADAVASMDSFYQRAYALISSREAREAFNLAAEPGAVRDEYGRTASGQRMLLARRLVEAGVRFVSLTAGGWDHHERIADGIRGNLPDLDRAFAALIRDLDRRGRLDTTLVLMTTEFGRTPKINKDGGRDHWPRVFSVVAAGGGFRRGVVHGASNATGTEPESDKVGVEDLAATVYHLIGIDANRELMAPGGRPIEIVKDGRVIRELMA